MTSSDYSFAIRRVRFDETYRPAADTRITTNFANLARGQCREANLRKALRMIDNRFNALAAWDNPDGDRYAVETDIVTVEFDIRSDDRAETFPIIEMLETAILDRQTGTRTRGVVGNNFSSYVRDYDFSVLLPAFGKSGSLPDDFGCLHGNLFKRFIASDAYRAEFAKPPVICLSVSSSRTYHKMESRHPVLGAEYRQDAPSATDDYFAKMGMRVRYFMPDDSAAPLAFYFVGDLLVDYTNLELIGMISTMETFQKIYRPEIYNANSRAGRRFRPSLSHQDYSLTQIVYDREERSRLAIEQGRFAEQRFIIPYRAMLERAFAGTVQ
ncbi:MAG: DUF1852 family protein [Sphingomonas fennica]